MVDLHVIPHGKFTFLSGMQQPCQLFARSVPVASKPALGVMLYPCRRRLVDDEASPAMGQFFFYICGKLVFTRGKRRLLQPHPALSQCEIFIPELKQCNA